MFGSALYLLEVVLQHFQSSVTLTVFFQFLVPFLSGVIIEELKQYAFFIIIIIIIFCFFYSQTELCTRSCSVFFFSMLSITHRHVTSRDVMIPKELIQFSSRLLPTDDCCNAMCLSLLLLTDCTLTSATITMLLLQLTHFGPCINAQRQESV